MVLICARRRNAHAEPRDNRIVVLSPSGGAAALRIDAAKDLALHQDLYRQKETETGTERALRFGAARRTATLANQIG